MTEKDYEDLCVAVAKATKEQEVVISSSRFFGGGEKLVYKTLKYIDPGALFVELKKLQEKSRG